jgi:hypothetical protein
MPDMQTDAIRRKPSETNRSLVGRTFLSAGSGGFPAATTSPAIKFTSEAFSRGIWRFLGTFIIKKIFCMQL